MARSDGWYSETEFRKPLDIYNKINVNQIRDVSYDVAVGGRWYIFMVRPSCNITDETITNSRILYNNLRLYKQTSVPNGGNLGNYILSALNFNHKGGSYSPIIEILTNTAKSFSPSDQTMDVVNVAETVIGWKHAYAKHDANSLGANTFSIEYMDIGIDLPVYNLHLAWYEYIKKIRGGIFEASQECLNKRVLDYPSALYYFYLAPDGYTLMYWCKYTGVFPIKLPHGSFAGNSNQEPINVSIDYQYVKKDDMDPIVLVEFNRLFGRDLPYNERQDYPTSFLQKLDNWISGSKTQRNNNAYISKMIEQQQRMDARSQGMTYEQYLALNVEERNRLYMANKGKAFKPESIKQSEQFIGFRTVPIQSLTNYVCTTEEANFESNTPEIVLLNGYNSGSSRLSLIFN